MACRPRNLKCIYSAKINQQSSSRNSGSAPYSVRFCRVDAALSATVDLNSTRFPPSVLDRVNLHCAAGINLLLRESLSDEERKQLETLVSESEMLLAGDGAQLQWLEKEISAIEAAVEKIFCGSDKKLLQNPDPWSSLCGQVLKEIPGMTDVPFFPTQYAARDRRAILFRHIQRYAALAATPFAAR